MATTNKKTLEKKARPLLILKKKKIVRSNNETAQTSPKIAPTASVGRSRIAIMGNVDQASSSDYDEDEETDDWNHRNLSSSSSSTTTTVNNNNSNDGYGGRDNDDHDEAGHLGDEEEEDEEGYGNEGDVTVHIDDAYHLPVHTQAWKSFRNSPGNDLDAMMSLEDDGEDDYVTVELQSSGSSDDDGSNEGRGEKRDGGKKASAMEGGGKIYVAFYTPAKTANLKNYRDYERHANPDGENKDEGKHKTDAHSPYSSILKGITMGLYILLYDAIAFLLGHLFYCSNRLSSWLTRSDLYPEADYSHVEMCTDDHTYFIKWGGAFTRLEGKQFPKDRYGLLVLALGKRDYEHVVKCCEDAYRTGLSFNYYGSVFNFLIPKWLLKKIHGRPAASSSFSCAAAVSTTNNNTGVDRNDGGVDNDDNDDDGEEGNVGYRSAKKKFCSEFIAETLSGTDLLRHYFLSISSRPSLHPMQRVHPLQQFKQQEQQQQQQQGRTEELPRRYYPQLMSPNKLYELLAECSKDTGRITNSYHSIKSVIPKKNGCGANNNNNNNSGKHTRKMIFSTATTTTTTTTQRS